MSGQQTKQGRIPETTLQCIQHLRLHHPRSSISVELEKPGRDGLRELAREADVVFYSRSWAEVSVETPQISVYVATHKTVPVQQCSSKRVDAPAKAPHTTLFFFFFFLWGAKG